MHPVLFQIGDFPVPTYGVVYLFAFLSSVVIASRLGPRVGIPSAVVIDAGFQMMIAGEVASRLTFLVVEWDRVVSGEMPWRQFLVSGRVLMGGVVGGFLYTNWFIQRHGIAARNIADLAFTVGAYGIAIGRIGCLLGGCCYGAETTWSWGIVFDDATAHRVSGTPLGSALHPTQVVQAALNFGVFFVLMRVLLRRRFVGQAAGWFFILTGTVRFAVEFLRGDPRGHYFGLSTSQWIGVGFVLLGTAWLAWARRLADSPPKTRSGARMRARPVGSR